MKKVFLILLTIAMCLSLFACSSVLEFGNKDEETVEEVTYDYFDEYRIPMPYGLDLDHINIDEGLNDYFFIIPAIMANAAEQVLMDYLALLQDFGVECVENVGSYILMMDGKAIGHIRLNFSGNNPMTALIVVSLYDDSAVPSAGVEEMPPEEPVEMPVEEPKPAVPDPVEITMDNWSEYFEFTYTYDYDYNGFDELEDVTMWFYFSLKPEYAAMLDGDKSEVTVEIFFVTGTQYGTFSEDYLEFTPDGYFDEWFDYESAREQNVHELNYSSSSGTFRTSYQTAHADFEESSMGPWYPTQQEVIRIAGTLVFK